MFRKKILFALLIPICFFSTISSASAQIGVEELITKEQSQLGSVSFVVIDQKTGDIIIQKSASQRWVPASLTKMLTALVVIDQKPDFNKNCTVSPEDEVGGTRLNVAKKGVYKLSSLLEASLVASANNATTALARCVLPLDQFVVKMNQKAKALGAANSEFYEPSGMDARNVSNAVDLAKIARAAFTTPKIQQVTAKKTVVFSSVSKPKRSHTLKTTNELLKQGVDGVVAGKTGYLDESMYNFALSRKVSGQSTITVVLGSPTKAGSFADAKKLSGWAPILISAKNSDASVGSVATILGQ